MKKLLLMLIFSLPAIAANDAVRSGADFSEDGPVTGLGLRAGLTLGTHLNMFGLSGKHLELADSDSLLPLYMKKAFGQAESSSFSGTTGANIGLYAQYNLPMLRQLFVRSGANYDRLVTGTKRSARLTDNTAKIVAMETTVSGSIISIPLTVGTEIRSGNQSFYGGIGINFARAGLVYTMDNSRYDTGFTFPAYTSGPTAHPDDSFFQTINPATDAGKDTKGEVALSGSGLGYQFLLGYGYRLSNSIVLSFEWCYVVNTVTLTGSNAEDATDATKNKMADKAGELAAWELTGNKTRGVSLIRNAAGNVETKYELPVSLGGHTFQVGVGYEL